MFGAAPSTANLGVHALLHSTLQGIVGRMQATEVTVFDLAWNPSPLELQVGGQPCAFPRLGANPGRRLWRSENLLNMRMSRHIPGRRNEGVQAVRNAHAVLDISGGDSFTDLYGRKRFWTVTHPKRLALSEGTPLLLLPQTYGPFRDSRLRRVARDTVLRAERAWARDERSLNAARELIGPDARADHLRLGVDLAFALRPSQLPNCVTQAVRDWTSDASLTVAGVNVSGLLWNHGDGARDRFGLTTDYRAFMRGVVEGLLRSHPSARVVLVPHVLQPAGHFESDIGAAAELLATLTPEMTDRVALIDGAYGPSEAKRLIGSMDWFLGARMHSTIAALSSRVPTLGAAYSGKFKGVFEVCGQGTSVADLRSLATEEAIETAMASFGARDQIRADLKQTIPSVLQSAEDQLDEICEVIAGPGASAPSRHGRAATAAR